MQQPYVCLSNLEGAPLGAVHKKSHLLKVAFFMYRANSEPGKLRPNSRF